MTVHEQQKEGSVQLGKKAIDALVSKGLPVTLKNIHDKSKKVDPKGKGIHPNTVKSNEELYEYYKQHSYTYKQRQIKTKPPQINPFNETDLRKINPKRNLANVRHKYMKLSKEELVDRLISSRAIYCRESQKVDNKTL